MEKGLIDYELKENYEGYLLVKSCTYGMASNGTPFISVKLGDKTGTLTAMVWGSDEEKRDIFKAESIVAIAGFIGEFNGTKQINLKDYRKITDDDDVGLKDLLETASEEEEELRKELIGYIKSIENDAIRKITINIYNKHKENLGVYPAAKGNHHAYVTGLLYHIISMIRIANKLSKLYPIINRDLLVAGVILHDIGKIEEYSGYVAPEFTQEGIMKGHISIISEEIGKVAEKGGYGGEDVLLLQHMVLSHHGKKEWGSPVEPVIIEARMLHLIDMMDADMDAYKTATRGLDKGEYTGKIFSMGNKEYYNHELEGNKRDES